MATILEILKPRNSWEFFIYLDVRIRLVNVLICLLIAGLCLHFQETISRVKVRQKYFQS